VFYRPTQRTAGKTNEKKKMDLLIFEVWNKWDPKFKDRLVVDRESVSKKVELSNRFNLVQFS